MDEHFDEHLFEDFDEIFLDMQMKILYWGLPELGLAQPQVVFLNQKSSDLFYYFGPKFFLKKQIALKTCYYPNFWLDQSF